MTKREKQIWKARARKTLLMCVVAGPAIGFAARAFFADDIEVPPPPPPLKIPAPLPRPDLICGPSDARVCGFEISDSWCPECQTHSISACMEEIEREVTAEKDSVRTVMNYTVAARFGGGSNRADVVVEPPPLACASPPTLPVRPECDLESFKQEALKVGNVIRDLQKPSAYRQCRKQWEEYVPRHQAYLKDYAAWKQTMEERMSAFLAEARRRITQRYDALKSDPDFSDWTHLLRWFASVAAACADLRRNERLPPGAICEASLYSDFEPDYRDQGPDKKPKNFEQELRGVNLQGVRVRLYVIPHRAMEVGAKMQEVKEWFEAMGAQVEQGYPTIFEYDLR